MAEHRLNLRFPEKSTMVFSICLAGILLFIFAVILPYSYSLKSMDGRITDTKKQIQEQETLKSIHDVLQKESQKKEVTLLPLPMKTPLKRTEAGMIPGIIKEIAGRSKLELVSIAPDLNVLAGGATSLPVSFTLRGDFFRFRNFLSAVGGMTYLDRIEEMTINRGRDSTEFKMRVLLYVGS